MTSSKLILIFLGFIFLIIVILSSSRISAALRSRFGKLIPAINTNTEGLTPTPTIEVSETPTPTPTIVYGRGTTNRNNSGKNIPATGPADLAWLVLGGSFLTGVVLKKVTASKS